jgi:hypothetical protein
MKKQRIYTDTSVIGGCCDAEFKHWSLGLLKDFQLGVYSLILSVLIEAEIMVAPDEVKNKYIDFRQCATEVLELSREAIDLADEYLNRGILSDNYRDDARHIALAVTAQVDLLVSWNYKHVVHFDKIQMFNAVNIEMGYKPIQIFSPREVTKHGYQNT